MEGEEGSIVARLDPSSEVSQGHEAELWVDATRLHLFDPEDGRNLMVDADVPAAVGADSGADQDATGDRAPEQAEEPATSARDEVS
jgi:multiple sugar transport system ATP-binding protein